MSKKFTPNAPRVGVVEGAAAKPAAPEASKPGLVRQAPVDKLGDNASPPPYEADDVTTAIRGTWFVTGWRLDGCEDPAGLRYLFSRWYPEQRVLVDAFDKANDAVRLEVERKSAFLRAYNEQHEEKIGYLPYIVGADIRGDDAQLAGLGEVAPLVTRNDELQVA